MPAKQFYGLRVIYVLYGGARYFTSTSRSISMVIYDKQNAKKKLLDGSPYTWVVGITNIIEIS